MFIRPIIFVKEFSLETAVIAENVGSVYYMSLTKYAGNVVNKQVV
jgi:hypothetical protein